MKTMDRQLVTLLEGVRAGTVGVDEALDRLRTLPYENLGFARLDHHRALRQGFPEVVFCLGKTAEQMAQLMARLTARHAQVLASRATPEVYAAVRAAVPDAVYHEIARLIVVD